MWRPRDRERFIGGYDPEHEMPDPNRGSGERWQSDVYRHNSRDSRYAYRMNPDRFERQYEGPREPYDRWSGDAREMHRQYSRDDYNRPNDVGGNYDYDRDYGDRGYHADRNYGDFGASHYDRGYHGGGGYRDSQNGPRGGGYYGGYNGGGYGGHDRGWDRGPFGGGSDRGWDRNGPDRSGLDRDRGRSPSGPHYDRFGADRGMDHDRYTTDRYRGSEHPDRDDSWNDWRRRR
jgi:hypothetical protein